MFLWINIYAMYGFLGLFVNSAEKWPGNSIETFVGAEGQR
jgi:hypothetical protein